MAISYESTNRISEDVSFRKALITGQAPDKGLYTPSKVPSLVKSDFESFKNKPYHEIASEVLGKYLAGEVPQKVVSKLCRESYDFDVPLEKVTGNMHIMRLDMGPTASFKDFAARMMARLMSHFLAEDGGELTILTATSGDTGSAVANAFNGLKNIRVVVLFPQDEVTGTQRKQMTTLSGNVSCIAVDGKFDDCQALVKKAFADPELKELSLSSANSINVGRLLPQSVYYVYAYSRLHTQLGEKIVFSIPSGNFGDLMGGILAKRMGVPVKKFVVATNENDEFPKFLNTGTYKPITPSKACISNAMNVGHPSNLARLFHMYGGWMDEKGNVKEQPDIARMRKDLWAESVTDQDTRNAIRDAYQSYNTILEPHGAVGWKALTDYIKEDGNTLSVALETADPAKFPDEIVSILGVNPKVPKSLTGLDNLPERVTHLPADYESIKKYLKKLE